MLRRLRELEGWTVTARDGNVGSLNDFCFDDRDWAIRYLVVDTGNWLTGRSVLISPMSFEVIDWDRHLITVNLTRDEVERSPSTDVTKPVSRQYEAQYLTYFGYPYYWTGAAVWGVAPSPLGIPRATARREPEPVEQSTHLRSVREVSGYHIAAVDGEIGHVENFFFDDHSWSIRYLIVDTSNWIGGRLVLVSREWVSRVEWPRQVIHVNLPRQLIAESPTYDQGELLDRAYEERLHSHYARAGHRG